MPSVVELLEKQPLLQDITITTEGSCLWLCWPNDLDTTITQTLQDYGGLCVLQETGQSLWFFFTNDVLLALAKLVVWAKFNPLSMTIQAFPAVLQVGVGQALAISLERELASQKVPDPTRGLQAWVHPQLRTLGANIPGLEFAKGEIPEGMGQVDWTLLSADPRLPYSSSQGWYALLHPLGNPLDRMFQAGWRSMFAEVEKIVRHHKFKYSLHENFLMIPLDNLRQLREWVHDLLLTFSNIKESNPEAYWPCVSVVVDKRGLNFNNELHDKVNVNWEGLMPDFPYTNYRNGYLLGSGFIIQDLHFSSANSSMESWCNVNLAELTNSASSIPILMSGQLVAGQGPGCFYCGVRSHTSAMCPSRGLPQSPKNFWKDFNALGIDECNAAFRTIDQKLTRKGPSAYHQMLSVTDSPECQILQAVFAIGEDIQPRSIDRIWTLSGKDIQTPLEDGAYRDDSPAWSLRERFLRISPQEIANFERDIQGVMNRAPRDWRLRSLMGFVLVEKGDLSAALHFWREAESLCSSVLHQAWHCFLQARVLELLARYGEAIELYDTTRKLLPLWPEPVYRPLVCRIKMGFGDQVKQRVVDLVNQDATVFNRLLIDPELERGRKVVLSALYPQWADAEKLCEAEKAELEKLSESLATWFPEDHLVAAKLDSRLKKLMQDAQTKNYLAFFSVLKVRPAVEESIAALIKQEIERMQGKYQDYLASLEIIRDEASWFPVPGALVEFNKNFNECAGLLNWAFQADFSEPESFKKAQSLLPRMDEILALLEKRLRLLRVVRDGTLFVLILIRTFIWIEVVGILLAFTGVFALSMYGEAIGMGSLERLVRGNFWDLQKVLIGIISVSALSIASLRTTLVFEKRREKMLSDAKQQREAMQKRRLDLMQAKRNQNQARPGAAKPPQQEEEDEEE